MRGRGKESGAARAAQQPLGNGKPRDAGIGSVTQSGERQRDIAGLRTNGAEKDG